MHEVELHGLVGAVKGVLAGTVPVELQQGQAPPADDHPSPRLGGYLHLSNVSKYLPEIHFGVLTTIARFIQSLNMTIIDTLILLIAWLSSSATQSFSRPKNPCPERVEVVFETLKG